MGSMDFAVEILENLHKKYGVDLGPLLKIKL